MSQSILESLHRLKLAGASDAAAILSIGAGAALSAPMFIDKSPIIGAALFSAIGFAHLSKRFFESSPEEFVLDGSFKFISSPTPEEEQIKGAADGVMQGYTIDGGKRLNIPMDDFTRHMLIAGQSGVGKTVAASYMLYQHIQRGAGVMFVDGKVDVENQAMIARMARQCGREHDVLYICPGTPQFSNTYNPILKGDPDEVAARLLSLIPSTENNPGADYYKQAANQGLTTLIGAIQRTGLAYNFMDLAILLTNANAMSELERIVQASAPNSNEAKNLSLFLEQFKVSLKPGMPPMLDMKKIKDVFGGIGGRLFTFGTGNFGKVLNSYSPDVDLFDAIKKNKIIYVALPTMGKAVAANNFGKMIMGDLRTVVSWLQMSASGERPNPPYLVMADEYGSYANVADKIMFEQNRSAGVTMCPIIQTFSSLDALSPEFSEMVLGNTWTKIFFKVGTQDTATRAADLIGMTKVIMRGLSVSQNESKSAAFLQVAPQHNSGGGAGISESEKESEEYLVTPDDIKGMDKGEALVLYGGNRVYHIKVPFLKLPGSKAPETEIRVNKFRPKYSKGLDFFKNSDRYISKGDFDAD